MTEPSRSAPQPFLSVADAAVVGALFARHHTAWTWPETLRAVDSALIDALQAGVTALADVPDGLARAISLRILDGGPLRDPVAVFVHAAARWTLPADAAPRSIETPGPTPSVGLPDELPELHDVEQFAHWLDFTVPELEWFADREGRLRTARPTLRHYRVWRRDKRSGVRVIEAPKPRMRETQRRLLRRLVERIPAHQAARGFEPGSSTAAFAWPHTDRPTVLRVDLRHCFESVPAARVRRVFADVGYPASVARLLAELCTTTTPIDELTGIDSEHAMLLRGRHLPQGAPTSPHLANLAMRSLDRRITGFAELNGLRYTRYGDDLAISGDEMDAGRALWTVARIIRAEGFTVHPEKVRIMGRHQQQRLAGLVVNDRPRVSRVDYDNLRALLHNAIRDGATAQNREGHPEFRSHVYGLIAWVGATDPARRRRLLAMAADVDWDA
ncbi:reverse transcriptase family protein [Gordonia soli]|uniref:RNA-directed DNA polymerase n=1 Tax=Gordonia soli NBRC 108243 TaxID=1223545 RepID=M0QE90_9ACTN|nr:reverse transcriptase family protein [Gordonia soli]GAC66875.1 putative RNA-directed DNA polymerase [Gordonia soli NBRC 108243]